MTDFSHLNNLHMGGIERDLKAGKYVEPEVLAAALRKHGSQPIPPEVLDYLCRFLEGSVPIPKGRKPWPKFDRQRFETLVAGLYRRYLERLTDRKRLYGQPAGWTKLDGTPAEVAARIVAKRFMYGAESWRRVQNIASSRK